MFRSIHWLWLGIILFCPVDNVWAEKCEGKRGGEIGNCAPNFELTGIDKKTYRFEDYVGKKVLFLNFWASWCEPCKDEIPAMVAANKALKNKNVQILAISIDSDGEKDIRAFFKGSIPEFPQLMDSTRRVSREYGTFKVPETYIIDKTGKIRDKVEGIKAWDDPLIIHYLELLAEQ